MAVTDSLKNSIISFSYSEPYLKVSPTVEKKDDEAKTWSPVIYAREHQKMTDIKPFKFKRACNYF